ncbi:hypothetical protein E3E31_00025 [Thermococcus sp. M39]|uniref:hypothetical protein n=1 Tax=Thermococcus sp. M39 TaxID=1638262 RepID=UPI0014387271|nr:hypothetical protein [Thermococcus sp. M39]NJE06943.1 hypothetical protein [Thermococcus sp. M39]
MTGIIFKSEEELYEFIRDKLPLIAKAVRWIYGDDETYGYILGAVKRFLEVRRAYQVFSEWREKVSGEELLEKIRRATEPYDARDDREMCRFYKTLIPEECSAFVYPFYGWALPYFFDDWEVRWFIVSWDGEMIYLYEHNGTVFICGWKRTKLRVGKDADLILIPKDFLGSTLEFKKLLTSALAWNNEWVQEMVEYFTERNLQGESTVALMKFKKIDLMTENAILRVLYRIAQLEEVWGMTTGKYRCATDLQNLNDVKKALQTIEALEILFGTE